MSTFGLDDRMKRLLRDIRGGRKEFQAAGKSTEDLREFDLDAKCLIAMKNRGLIPHNDLHLMMGSDGPHLKYLSAIINSLTYEGEMAADELDLAPAAEALHGVLSQGGLIACRRDLDRAISSVASDPAQAIASACATLESVCKAILAQVGQAIPSNQAIQSLITETTKALNLAPEVAAEVEMKRILGAVSNISAAVGTLRTKYGAAHGQTDDRTPLKPVHARFAINAMAAVALFLLETALDGERKT
ncbi:abortive infection family protein [Candidatus Thiodictyon syntrophicum]|jgi:hypothetical protein|uniref:Abortive infection protein-like C-terminal domain-containing protein n=1 Tax=Candidatus Thiodictyon syntrophicum TaxID=1166950 RepID=A0A2K8U434_9GAMM|nr:abortive infection family protein [Candidatus Thiodictyon syntrophicum]AUB80317.1 hypothetical protein THSYN_04675 [Candidatus Thiodictyon syntrophicum]